MNNKNIIPFILYLTVFSSGAGVLVMEVVAVRLLSPYFGTSLYVLSSVLTIVLFALSMGYFWGGRISDKFPFHTPLYVIIFLGGSFVLLIAFFALFILPSVAPHLPIVLGPLFISGVLFFVPAFLLGIDSPYVIKLLTQHTTQDISGSVVGTTFFWSTAGSITGSLLAGFLLIPTFGLMNTILGTGTFLIALGVGGGFLVRLILKKGGQYDKRNDLKLRFVTEGFIGLGIVLFMILTVTQHANALYYKDGHYSSILIFDGMYKDTPTRFLKRDTNNSSAIYIERDDPVFSYAQFVELYKQLVPEAKTFLMLGGGAYTIPRKVHLDNPEMSIDVVEIEPSLYPLAIEYFRLPKTEKIVNHVYDARVYVQRTEKKYDVVFVDIFSTGHFVPPHLTSREFFESIKNVLTPNGVVIMNFIGKVPDTKEQTLTGSFSKTIQTVFPNVEIFTTMLKHGHYPINLMYVAQNGDEKMSIDRSSLFIDSNDQITQLSEATLFLEGLVHENDVVFTDNHTPVESLLVKEQLSSY